MLRPHLAHTAISCQKAGLTKINEAVPFAVLQYNAKQIEYLVEPYRELQSGNYGDDWLRGKKDFYMQHEAGGADIQNIFPALVFQQYRTRKETYIKNDKGMWYILF